MTCTCKSCNEMHRFFEIINTLPNLEDRQWMEELYRNIDAERLDADVNQAIIEGTWAGSDEKILAERTKILIKQAKKDADKILQEQLSGHS